MLSSEKEVINTLNAALQDNEVVYITGNSGCGKEYSVSHYLEENYKNKYIKFSLPFTKMNSDEYAPFKETFIQEPFSGLGFRELAFQGADLAKEQSDIKVSLLGFLSNFLIKIAVDKESNALSAFDNLEVDFIAKMNNIIRKRHLKIISFFNVCDWDDKSKGFLCHLIQYKKQIKALSNVRFVITGQDENPDFLAFSESKKAFKIRFPQLDVNYENEQQIFEFVLNKSLTWDLYNKLLPVIKICNNDLNLLKLLISEELYCEEISSDDKLKGMKSLLEYKLSSMGANKSNIESILKHASVLGMYFSISELEKILEKSKNEFVAFIDYAQELLLINSSDSIGNSYSFAHEFIQKVLELSISSENVQIYDKAQQMVSKLYPYDYIRRARYCVKAKDYENAKKLYALYILRNIRNSENLPETIKSESERLFNIGVDRDTWINCIDLYKDGVKLYNIGNYDKAAIIFMSINKILPKEIMCEIDIMISMCRTKKLDISSRMEAADILKNDLMDEKPCCISVKERMQVRLIILYAHLNMTLEANKTEEQLLTSLSKRISYDTKASETVALLDRISNSHYSCDISCNKMKNAVNFFMPSKESFPINITQYFNALTNYSGALCMCGQFDKSFEFAHKAIALKTQFLEVNYPREYFVANNYIISGFLSKNLSVKDCIIEFKKIIDTVPDSADCFLFFSNLAVFYSLADDQNAAIDTLTKAATKYNVNKDPEKIYNYRYATNVAIFYFLLGDACTAKKILLQCEEIDLDIPDSKFMRNKLLMLTDLFNQDKERLSPHELLYYFTKENSNSTPEKYYYLGYTFTTQYNWDID